MRRERGLVERQARGGTGQQSHHSQAMIAATESIESGHSVCQPNAEAEPDAHRGDEPLDVRPADAQGPQRGQPIVVQMRPNGDILEVRNMEAIEDEARQAGGPSLQNPGQARLVDFQGEPWPRIFRRMLLSSRRVSGLCG